MAATGTPTPNIGLRIPQGTDPASVDDINYNSNLLDTKLGAVGNTSVQDQIDSLNSKFAYYGKELYAAPDKFTSGSITVPDLSKYFAFELTFTDTLTMIAFKTVDNSVLWGGLNIGAYGSNSIQTYACRYAVSGNDLTINASNRGYTNGTDSNYSGLTAGLKRVIGLIMSPTQI